MSAAAGYFGGYTAKEQPIGIKETRMLGISMEHKAASVTKGKTSFLDFVKYSRCLVRDLEAKGLARTAVEGINLSIHADDKDVLNAECYRTFPTCTFPAASLLKREEVECGRNTGVSVIAAVLQNKSKQRKSYLQEPFDILYGFRGTEYNVDVLSAYEMLLFWRPVSIHAPLGSMTYKFASRTKF